MLVLFPWYLFCVKRRTKCFTRIITCDLQHNLPKRVPLLSLCSVWRHRALERVTCSRFATGSWVLGIRNTKPQTFYLHPLMFFGSHKLKSPLPSTEGLETFHLVVPGGQNWDSGNGLNQPQQASAVAELAHSASSEAQLCFHFLSPDPAGSCTGSLPVANLKQHTVRGWFKSCHTIIVSSGFVGLFCYDCSSPYSHAHIRTGVKIRPMLRKLITENQPV